jgi:exodeoxyribonuclease VII small subunit
MAKSYQQLKSELDEIVAQLQSDKLDIDEAAKLYEKGLETITQLEKYLQTAENNITKVRANFAQQSQETEE